MITIKLPYNSTDDFKLFLNKLRKQQSSAIRSAYNKFKEGKSTKEVNQYIKSLKNIDLLNSWLLYSATNKATQYSTDKKVIFGGKQNLIRYNNKKITKEEYQKKRLSNLISTGEANQKGNRFFKLDISNNKIIFKYGFKQHYELVIPKLQRSYLKNLTFIQKQAENKLQPFTIELNDEFIYISFEPEYKSVTDLNTNRIFSIDMNPNEIGWAVLEFDKNDKHKIIDSGIVNNAKLNVDKKTTKYNTNKRTHECYQISKFLYEKSLHYKCKKFVIEDLVMENKNHNRGRRYNRLINNNWNRKKLINNLTKRCESVSMEIVTMNPSYSSFVGNVVYGKDFADPICSAIELGRRGHKKFVKGWFYPKLVMFDDLPKQWKQEVSSNYKSWVELFNNIKKMELKYHFSWKNTPEKFQVLSLKSPKSRVEMLKRKDEVNI